MYISWKGLGVGDHNACDWAQELHVYLLKSSGVLADRHAIRYKRPLPRNPENDLEGVMIDDRVGFQIYSDRGQSSRTCRGPAAQTPEGRGFRIFLMWRLSGGAT